MSEEHETLEEVNSQDILCDFSYKESRDISTACDPEIAENIKQIVFAEDSPLCYSLLNQLLME